MLDVHIIEVRRFLERAPFHPFRIRMSDGSAHDVTDPNLVFVTRSTVMIGVLEPGEDIPDRVVYCDTLHITQVETIGSS